MSILGIRTSLAAHGIDLDELKKAAGAPGDPTAIDALTPVSVDDATDGTTAAALANANKAAINAIIAALQG